MTTDPHIISIKGIDEYPLSCRFWQATDARAIVVLVHGVVSHSSWLDAIADGLRNAGISCLATDRRGAGLNEDARGDAPDADTLIGDLDAIMKWTTQFRVPRHLCGFCWGANYVVNYLSQKAPDIETVSLLAPSLFPSDIITDQPFTTGESGKPSEVPVMPIECFTDGPAFEQFIKPDPFRLKRVSPRLNRIMAEFSQGLWMKFLRLKLPVLVILGQQDAVVDNAATERVFERLPIDRKALFLVPGKHGLQFDAADAVNQHLIHWISGSSNDTLSHTKEA